MYSVYILIDPRDSLIYYVGISINVQKRFKSHIHGYGANREKVNWIMDLRRYSLIPILEIIASGLTYEEALYQELRYIKHYLTMGMPLVNRDGVVRRQEYRKEKGEKKKTVNLPTHQKKPTSSIEIIKTEIIRIAIIKPYIEELLTPKEVAQALHTSERAVKTLIESGKLKGRKIGNRWRITPESLRNYQAVS